MSGYGRCYYCEKTFIVCERYYPVLTFKCNCGEFTGTKKEHIEKCQKNRPKNFTGFKIDRLNYENRN